MDLGVVDLGKHIFPQCPKTVIKPVKVTAMNLLCRIQGSWLISLNFPISNWSFKLAESPAET